MSTVLSDWLDRQVGAGVLPGAVALLGRDRAEVVAAGVAAVAKALADPPEEAR